MSRESNYFEEAMALCRDPAPPVSRLAEALYRRMLEESRQQGRSPEGAFNILYYMQTVIRAWLSRHPEVMLTDTQFPLECECINGVNWPEQFPTESPIIPDFVSLVQADSVPAGDEFDVAYATEIMALLFDSDDAIRPSAIAQPIEAEFDDWLSGFNNDQLLESPFNDTEKNSKNVKSQ